MMNFKWAGSKVLTFIEGDDGSNLICMSITDETILSTPVSISISTADIPGGAQCATVKTMHT